MLYGLYQASFSIKLSGIKFPKKSLSNVLYVDSINKWKLRKSKKSLLKTTCTSQVSIPEQPGLIIETIEYSPDFLKLKFKSYLPPFLSDEYKSLCCYVVNFFKHTNYQIVHTTYSLSKWSNYPFFIFLCPKIVSVKNPNTLNSPNSIRKILAMFFEKPNPKTCVFYLKNLTTV